MLLPLYPVISSLSDAGNDLKYQTGRPWGRPHKTRTDTNSMSYGDTNTHGSSFPVSSPALGKATYPVCSILFSFFSLTVEQLFVCCRRLCWPESWRREREPNKNHTLIKGNTRLLLLNPRLQHGGSFVCLSLWKVPTCKRPWSPFQGFFCGLHFSKGATSVASRYVWSAVTGLNQSRWKLFVTFFNPALFVVSYAWLRKITACFVCFLNQPEREKQHPPP